MKPSEYILAFIRKHTAITILLAFLVFMGVSLASDYGTAWDDQGLWDYSDKTIVQYQDILKGEVTAAKGLGNLRYYGPAFLTFERIFADLVLKVMPWADRVAIWHFGIFVTFIIAAASLYSVAEVVFAPRIAFGITVLFCSQPLLWGHAFINAKDTPFLASFLLSVALGIRMCREFTHFQGRVNTGGNSLSNYWRALPKSRRRTLPYTAAFLAGLSFIIVTVGVWAKPIVHYLISYLISSPSTFFGRMLATLAPGASNLTIGVYVNKALAIGRSFGIFVMLLGWLLFFLISLPAKSKDLLAYHFLSFLRDMATFLRSPRLILCGFALGIATSIRVIGPVAGILVIGYWLVLKGKRALPATVPYLLIATFVTIVFWPFLWTDPIGNFLESLTEMANFTHGGNVLFNGRIYSNQSLPFLFLPVLILVQFTIPAVILMIGGLANAMKAAAAKNAWPLLMLAWFVPIFAFVVLAKPTLYDNFRQLLFITPPLFLVAGYALNRLSAWLKFEWLYWFLVATIGISGALSSWQLHPYQYVFYNAAVGGVQGAQKRFEMDYWATAFTAATIQLNEIAPKNSRVVVWGPASVIQLAAREDLLVENQQGSSFDLATGYQFAVINLRAARDTESIFPSAPTIIAIGRLGVPFAVVKQLPP